jgi:hypothetical protein
MPGKHQRSYVLQLTDAPKRRLKFDLFAKVAFQIRRHGTDFDHVGVTALTRSPSPPNLLARALAPLGALLAHANRFPSPQHGAEGAAGTDSAIKA